MLYEKNDVPPELRSMTQSYIYIYFEFLILFPHYVIISEGEGFAPYNYIETQSYLYQHLNTDFKTRKV